MNHTTVWSDHRAGDHAAVETFLQVARTLERGVFDAMFFGQGLRLREHLGRIFELDVAGRPDTATLLPVLAHAAPHLGFVATVNATFTEPLEVARTFAALGHLTDGRVAWNVVTTHDAFTGENHRRGGYLAHEDRYRRAEDVVRAAEAYWSADGGRTPGYVGDLAALPPVPTLPAPPGGGPVYVQAGDSPDGRDLAARFAEVVFSRHVAPGPAADLSRDLAARLAAHGRRREDLRILPIARIVLGATDAEAHEKARETALAQVSPARALVFAEQVWGRPLDGVDPDGPLPELEPATPPEHLMQGRVQSKADPAETVRGWRERARAQGHSLRSLMADLYGRPTFVGTPTAVARRMADLVATGHVDGFALGAYVVPVGYDEIVDLLVPALQELGAYPDRYAGTTLRDHLDLPPRDDHGAPDDPTRTNRPRTGPAHPQEIA